MPHPQPPILTVSVRASLLLSPYFYHALLHHTCFRALHPNSKGPLMKSHPTSQAPLLYLHCLQSFFAHSTTVAFATWKGIFISQNHRITEWSGLEGTSVGHLGQPPCRSRVTQSRLHRRVLNISREGDSTGPLGSLFQCSITLRVKKLFLIFSWNFLCFLYFN